jgi:hypothetical protein
MMPSTEPLDLAVPSLLGCSELSGRNGRDQQECERKRRELSHRGWLPWIAEGHKNDPKANGKNGSKAATALTATLGGKLTLRVDNQNNQMLTWAGY